MTGKIPILASPLAQQRSGAPRQRMACQIDRRWTGERHQRIRDLLESIANVLGISRDCITHAGRSSSAALRLQTRNTMYTTIQKMLHSPRLIAPTVNTNPGPVSRV
jgi:hypothetical protein